MESYCSLVLQYEKVQMGKAKFTVHNGLLGSRFSHFCLSDFEENMRVVISAPLFTKYANISACEWKYSRLLRKDYELSVTSAQTLIKISHIHTLLERL